MDHVHIVVLVFPLLSDGSGGRRWEVWEAEERTFFRGTELVCNMTIYLKFTVMKQDVLGKSL